MSLALGAFSTVTTEFLPIGLLTNIAASLGVTAGTAGLMVTMPGVLAAVAGPALIIASGRLDRRAVLIALSALLVVSNVLAACAQNFTTMLIARLLLGMCVGGFWTFAPGATTHLVPADLQGKAMSYVLAGISVATVVGVPAGALLGNLVGWRSSFGVVAVLSAAILVLQMRLLPAMPPARATQPRDLLVPLLRPASAIGLFVALLLIAGHFASYTYLTPLLQQKFGLPSVTVTSLLLLYGVAGFFGTFIGGRLVMRNARGTLLLAAATISLVLILSAFSNGGLLAGILVAGVWGLAFGLIPVSMTAWMLQALPDAPEAGQALLVTSFQIAIASGALFGGRLVDSFGIGGALTLGGVLAAAAAVTVAASMSRGAARYALGDT
ncbi:MAG: MFS transporter [Steroidobacteraceae bacterium]